MSRHRTYTYLGCLAVAVALALTILFNREPDTQQGESSSSVPSKVAEHPVVSGSSSAPVDSAPSTRSSRLQNKPLSPAESGSPATHPQREILSESNVSTLQPIHSGPMRADAAVGGRPAHATARVGETEVKLRPDQRGTFQTLDSLPEQSIDFTVTYPGLAKDSEVTLGVMDGGELIGPATRLTGSRGDLQFTFRTGSFPGTYRIHLTTPDGDLKVVDIWVDTSPST